MLDIITQKAGCEMIDLKFHILLHHLLFANTFCFSFFTNKRKD